MWICLKTTPFISCVGYGRLFSSLDVQVFHLNNKDNKVFNNTYTFSGSHNKYGTQYMLCLGLGFSPLSPRVSNE